jgi:hypothetical protein
VCERKERERERGREGRQQENRCEEIAREIFRDLEIKRLVEGWVDRERDSILESDNECKLI